MSLSLFMILLGCRPKGRHTEQHDIFFGIAESLSALKPAMQAFWPGVQLHIDAWRSVTNVNGYQISVASRNEKLPSGNQLFFLNLGGYKHDEFEEFHYKLLTVAANKGKALNKALQSAFYKHTSLPGNAKAHIDDRYGVDVDDVYAIKDILPAADKARFSIHISNSPDATFPPDTLHVGYTSWSNIE